MKEMTTIEFIKKSRNKRESWIETVKYCIDEYFVPDSDQVFLIGKLRELFKDSTIDHEDLIIIRSELKQKEAAKKKLYELIGRTHSEYLGSLRGEKIMEYALEITECYGYIDELRFVTYGEILHFVRAYLSHIIRWQPNGDTAYLSRPAFEHVVKDLCF